MEKSELNITFSIENILKKNNIENKTSQNSSIKLEKLQTKNNSKWLPNLDETTEKRLLKTDMNKPRWILQSKEQKTYVMVEDSRGAINAPVYYCCGNESAEEDIRCDERCFQQRLKMRRIGHPYQSRAAPKHKAPRNTFTQLQINQLERLFERTKYLSSSERLRIARRLQMTDNQLKTWYQNRRTKLKREINELKEQQLRIRSQRQI